MKRFTVVIESDDLDGGFVASSPEAPGCVSQGPTVLQAIENFADAFAGWALEQALKEPGTKRCRPTESADTTAARATARRAAAVKGAATRARQANARRQSGEWQR